MEITKIINDLNVVIKSHVTELESKFLRSNGYDRGDIVDENGRNIENGDCCIWSRPRVYTQPFEFYETKVGKESAPNFHNVFGTYDENGNVVDVKIIMKRIEDKDDDARFEMIIMDGDKIILQREITRLTWHY